MNRIHRFWIGQPWIRSRCRAAFLRKICSGIMTVHRYGDMEAFAASLRRSGYSEVRLIDITEGMFKSDLEATLLDLGGSRLLVGRK